MSDLFEPLEVRPEGAVIDIVSNWLRYNDVYHHAECEIYSICCDGKMCASRGNNGWRLLRAEGIDWGDDIFYKPPMPEEEQKRILTMLSFI